MVQIISRPQRPLLGKIIITSQIKVLTGLHIGGGGENLDIGGLDHSVVRDPLTQQPYLPGSSIKGKLRSILERLLNKPVNRHGGSGIYRYESDDTEDGYTEIGKDKFVEFTGAKKCPLSRVFGSTGESCWIEKTVADEQGLEYKEQDKRKINDNAQEHVKIKGRNYSARLIVRDAHLDEDSVEKLQSIDTGLYMTEWKCENTIDRVTAAANPRQIERVPMGSIFNFEMVYTVENKDQVEEDLANLVIALKILEDDALGGHGSRGYGKIRLINFDVNYRDLNFYLNITRGDISDAQPLNIDNTDSLLENFREIKNLLPEEDEEDTEQN